MTIDKDDMGKILRSLTPEGMKELEAEIEAEVAAEMEADLEKARAGLKAISDVDYIAVVKESQNEWMRLTRHIGEIGKIMNNLAPDDHEGRRRAHRDIVQIQRRASAAHALMMAASEHMTSEEFIFALAEARPG